MLQSGISCASSAEQQLPGYFDYSYLQQQQQQQQQSSMLERLDSSSTTRAPSATASATTSDNDEAMSSTSTSVKSPKKKSPRTCSRCKVHGVTVSLSGHKNFCMYKYCLCEGCRLVLRRQYSMAIQTSDRRGVKLRKSKKELQPGEVNKKI